VHVPVGVLEGSDGHLLTAHRSTGTQRAQRKNELCGGSRPLRRKHLSGRGCCVQVPDGTLLAS